MLGHLLATTRLVLMLSWIAVCMPFQLFFRAFNMKQRITLPRMFHHIYVRYILDVHVEVVGTISTHAPTLFISNHLSYLDIPVLGSVMPVSFISKAEVEKWPLFGFLGKLQDTVFVERRRSQTQKHSKSIAAFLARGRSLTLFPEGTSSDGHHGVLPFKTGLLSGVTGDEISTPVMVQPVSIACFHATPGKADMYPWYGDMTLVEHLWPFFMQHGMHVRVTFLAPVNARDFPDRKALADYAFQQINRAPHGVLA